MKRRQFLFAALAAPLGTVCSAHAADDTITVYKSPT
jgi:hypothetical protein